MFGEIVGGIGGMVGGLFGQGAMNEGYRKARGEYDLGIGQLKNTDWQSQDAWKDAVEDPYGRNAQQGALGQLQGIADSRGMDAGGRAAMQEGNEAVDQREAAGRGAAMQGAAMRGQVRGPQTAAAALAGQQTATTGRALASRGGVADARQRALGAAQASGQLGTQYRGQSNAWAGDKMNAGNAIGTFNANQRGNQAQALNGAYINKGNSYTNQGAAQQKAYTAIGAGAGAAAGGAMDMMSGAGVLGSGMKNLTRGVA